MDVEVEVNEKKRKLSPVSHCKYFVKRKKRYCKMTVKNGFEYCGEHMPSSTNEDESAKKCLRVVCPLDSKHTCYAHKLEKHLKICNARPDPSLPYINKNINTGPSTLKPNSNEETKRQLSQVGPAVIKDLVDRLNKIYDDVLMGKISTSFKKHDVVEEELKKPDYGDKTRKHLVQASSILGILEENGLMKDGVCFVEFGAGKGQLTYWISKATKQTLKNASVMLVERASHRHKFDNKLDKSDGKVIRIKADIADFDMGKVDGMNGCKVVAVTKHLCGGATDLALRCMENYDGQVLGTVMAFCCHHRCTWSVYTGHTFFKEQNLTAEDFDVMCGMVSWAICGTGKSRDLNNTENASDANDRDKSIGLTRDEKEEIGRRCKNLLDYGRMKFLEELGFECQLQYYVESNISPENVCVVAR